MGDLEISRGTVGDSEQHDQPWWLWSIVLVEGPNFNFFPGRATICQSIVGDDWWQTDNGNNGRAEDTMEWAERSAKGQCSILRPYVFIGKGGRYHSGWSGLGISDGLSNDQ